MSFPRYPAYKDSGVPWLGEVPAHWEVVSLKRLFSTVGDRATERRFPVALENIKGWTGRLVESEEKGEFDGDGVAFRRGDILYGKLRPYLAKTWLADCDGEAVGDFHVLRAFRLVETAFYRDLFLTPAVVSVLNSSTQGAKMPRVGWDFMGMMKVVQPPLPEQRAITAFVERETAKLDTLVAEQEGLLGLLEEKRAAVIAHIATRGLDPSVPTKDSGIDWLGRVPKHWQRAKLKHVGSIQGGAGFPDDFQYNPDERIPFYKVANLGMSLDGRTIGLSVHTVSKETAQLLRAAIIPAGSIVYAKIGAAMLLNRRRLLAQDSCIDNNMSALTVDERKANRDWVFLWAQVLDFKRLANPGPVPSFSEGVQRELPILIPPRVEQEALVERVHKETRAMDALSAEARVSIDLLRERRAALISAVVTGCIDVRTAASHRLGDAA